MKFLSMKPLVIGALLLLTAVLTLFMQPKSAVANGIGLQLDTLVPAAFGNWQIDANAPTAIVDPEVNAKLSVLYSQTLTRTYVNPQGQRMMLSIAYGNNQNRDFQVHRPEVCYTAQGFVIGGMNKNTIETSTAQIPVMRMIARQGNRNEPVTYWVRIGDDVVRGNMEQAFARMRYGLNRVVPDGLLFRISTISGDVEQAFAAEQQFVAALLQALPPAQRGKLIGAELAPV